MSASDREEPAPKEGGKGGQRGARSGSKEGQRDKGRDRKEPPREKEAAKAAEPLADKEDPPAEDAPFGKEPVFAKGTDDAPTEPAPPPDEGGVNRWIALAQKNTWIAVPLLLPAAIIVGMLQGAQAVVLLLLGAMLVAVITLFWNSIRTLLGETPLSGADAYAIAAPRAEEEQKQAVLRALKDLEFERSVGKISDEDYAVLVAKYRGEAKRLLRAIEEEARPRRESVEWLVHQRLVKAGLASSGEPYRGPAAGPKIEPAADAKKDTRKKKMKGADRPVVPPRDVERALAKGSDDAPKPHVDVTLKSSDAVTRTKESAAYVPPTKICAECGVKNDPDANFCKKCGSKAFEGAADRDAKKPAAEAQDAPADAGSGDEASRNEAAENEASENEASENEADHDKEAAR